MSDTQIITEYIDEKMDNDMNALLKIIEDFLYENNYIYDVPEGEEGDSKKKQISRFIFEFLGKNLEDGTSQAVVIEPGSFERDNLQERCDYEPDLYNWMFDHLNLIREDIIEEMLEFFENKKVEMDKAKKAKKEK